MSITQGMTGGGSWSGRRTLRAFPRGPGFTSLGRPNMQLITGISNTELLVSLALLPLVGPAVGLAPGVAVRGLNIATKPLFWAGVNAYEESADIRAWMRGEDMSWQLDAKVRPVRLHPLWGSQIGNVVPFVFPYLNFTKSPSSGVGGTGEIPNLHRPPISMKETGEILSNPPMAGQESISQVSSAKFSRWALRDRKWCSHRHPDGWKCGLEAGHRGRHRYTPQKG